jgi:prolipoprotein diacylglyceryl transferase
MRAGLITSIPSPSRGEVHLGPLPLRGYALMIILGVIASVIIGERRLCAKGYPAGAVSDIAIWAVPFGLVGARLYHVITDNQLYFRRGQDWVKAFYIWDGGLGIWGAIALGAVGAYIGCRQYKVRFSHLCDAMAVGLPVAQAIGRWGNWFNQELYGRPSTLPWALRIDLAHRLPQYANDATYQPTFLYECIWDLGVAGFVLLAERRQWFGRLSRGRAFWLYVAGYTVGRGWIEYLRVDEAHRFFGLRLNDYTSIVVFLTALAFLIFIKPKPGDEALPGTAGSSASEPAATREPSNTTLISSATRPADTQAPPSGPGAPDEPLTVRYEPHPLAETAPAGPLVPLPVDPTPGVAAEGPECGSGMEPVVLSGPSAAPRHDALPPQVAAPASAGVADAHEMHDTYDTDDIEALAAAPGRRSRHEEPDEEAHAPLNSQRLDLADFADPRRPPDAPVLADEPVDEAEPDEPQPAPNPLDLLRVRARTDR